MEKLKLSSLSDFEIYVITSHLAHFKIMHRFKINRVDAKKDWIPKHNGKGNRVEMVFILLPLRRDLPSQKQDAT